MATERYLLGEMTGPELDEFEEHMFVCSECADAVKSGAAFTQNAREVFRESPGLFRKRPGTAGERTPFFSKWFTFPTLATSFASLALLCVAGYQQFVVIPGVRSELAEATAPQGPADVIAVRRISRGAEAAQAIPASAKRFTLSFDVGRDTAGEYTAEVRDSGGHALFLTDGLKAQDGTVLLNIYRSRFPAGLYKVVLKAKTTGAELPPYEAFRIE
jgi:hypothetical protein